VSGKKVKKLREMMKGLGRGVQFNQ